MSTVQVEKLSGAENYSTWEIGVRALLMRDGLLHALTWKPKDDGFDVVKDQKALGNITLSLDTKLYTDIRKCATAAEAWDTLKTLYANESSRSRQLGLYRRFFQARLQDFSTMADYVREITSVYGLLLDSGCTLSDEVVAYTMLMGLPSSLNSLVTTLCSQTTFSTATVKAALIEHEAQEALTPQTSLVTGLAAVTCYSCGSKGHISRFCRKKQRNNVNQTQQLQSQTRDEPQQQTRAASQSKKKQPKQRDALLLALKTVTTDEKWYIDSGCVSHMSGMETSEKRRSSPVVVRTAGTQQLMSNAIGTYPVSCRGISKIENVRIAPDLTANLLSVSKMCDKGLMTVFTDKSCFIVERDDRLLRDVDIVATGSRVGGLYALDTTVDSFVIQNEKKDTVKKQENTQVEEKKNEDSKKRSAKLLPQSLWHARLGCLNHKSMRILRDRLSTGVNFENAFDPCVSCVKGKMKKRPFKSHDVRSSTKLERVHSDLVVVNEPSFAGYRYLLSFVDDFTRKCWVYGLHRKSDVFACFKEFKALVEKEVNLPIKIWRTDRGGEFVSNAFDSYLAEQGIRHETSVAYTPQQNGLAEKKQQDIMNKARCMLQHAGLPNEYWFDAAETAAYILNRCPSRVLGEASPESLWTGITTPNLSYMKVFGCVAYAYTHLRRKLDPKASKYVFVGYADKQRGYKLRDCSTGKLIIAREVKFFEDQFPSTSQTSQNIVLFYDEPESEIIRKPVGGNPVTPLTIGEGESATTPVVSAHAVSVLASPAPDANEYGAENSSLTPDLELLSLNDSDCRTNQFFESAMDFDPNSTQFAPNSSDSEQETVARIYETRQRDGELITTEIALSAETVNAPSSAREALQDERWREAMNAELDAINRHDTWTVVPRPKDKNVIDCRWVFRIKTDSAGQPRYKARIVAQGFRQQANVDYFETYSPVVRFSTLRLLLAMAHTEKLATAHLDVVSAFLHGKITAEIYCEFPPGLNNPDNNVLRLNKALYGLKQSPRTFYETIHEALLEMNFVRVPTEPCVYTLSENGKVTTILAIFVDDFLLISSSEDTMSRVKKILAEKFEIRDLGPVSDLLGLQITRSEESLKITQSKYIEKILNDFQMADCNPVSTPMDLTPMPDEPKLEPAAPYVQLLGCLQWLSTCTRPDISFAVNKLARYSQCPSTAHWTAAKRILRYLKGTSTHGLVFTSDDKQLNAFVDADWAGDSTRKSTSGFALFYGMCPISWESRLQKTVALSTCEAEYMAYSEITKEVLFIRQLLLNLRGTSQCCVVFTDSTTAQTLAENPMTTKRSKHIDCRYHRIRDEIAAGTLAFDHVPSAQMIADLLTKPLALDKFSTCKKELRVDS